ncbi:hypothetical protein CN918_27010 [Priestia megaterium]|nr:hypothetical protein CN918_27010 [Priestia megaterium]
MSFYQWICDNCGSDIKKIKRANMIQRNGKEMILCHNCLEKEQPTSFFPEKTAYDDIFQLEEFAQLRKDLEKHLASEEWKDEFSRQEDYDTLSQYQYKEMEKPQITPPTLKEPKQEQLSLDEAVAKLDALIGLPQIKISIHDLLKSFEGQKRLFEAAQGKIQIERPTLHMVFSGSDGTGKREVAKIVTDILFAAGHIKERKYVETDRSGLVGEHVGSTSPKVIKKVNEAIGGVLFIHEANALLSDNGKDFGKEAIATLSKEMEKHRENLVVILAGVESEMNQLLQQYPALASRIPTRFSFKDYTPTQLASIAQKMLEEKGYNCSEVLDDIKKIMMQSSKNGAIQGNGRWVLNFVQKVMQQHVIRFTTEEPENVQLLISQDIFKAVGTKDKHEQEGLLNVKEAALAELQELVGLKDLKAEVKRIMNFFAISKRKFEKGLSSSKPTMHMIFAGPPGTGKTTVAKIMAQFLKGEGILSNGHLKEVSRADLVGAHVGETALKVKKVIQESLGGILFIDEAYALDGGDKDSFGQEAIDTLIKEMEENRDDLIVILAGYENDMEGLLEKNAGFKSRVAYQFAFPNYDVNEMMQIMDLSLRKHKLVASKDTHTFLTSKLQELADENEGVIEGNGRWVRNFMDKLQISQSNRIMEENSEDLSTIVEADITEAMVYMEMM